MSGVLLEVDDTERAATEFAKDGVLVHLVLATGGRGRGRGHDFIGVIKLIC